MRSTDNIPVLRRLWKQCFEADSSFLDLFFGYGFRLCMTYTLEREGTTVSALSVFPVSYKGHAGGYVYGVCTDPAQRGHGYAFKLLQEVERYCMENEGMEFFLLRPADPTLFGYYQKQGYSYNIYRHREILPLPMIPAEIETSPLSAARYYSLRRRFYSWTGLVEWSEDTCGYILSYIGYCRGHAVEINGGESYLLSYPSPEDNGVIICEEAGLGIEITSLPVILSALRILYPDTASVLLSTPPQVSGEEYLLCKPLSFLPDSSAFFSFAME